MEVRLFLKVLSVVVVGCLTLHNSGHVCLSTCLSVRLSAFSYCKQNLCTDSITAWGCFTKLSLFNIK